MFFVLSKIFWSVAQPSSAIGLGFLVGMVLQATRWRRLGAWLVGLAAAAYMAIVWLPVGQLLLAPLENRFPIEPRIEGPVAGVLMLDGPVDSQMSMARGQVAIHDGAERYLEFVRLMRRYGQARGIVTGGNPTLTRDSAGQAAHGRTLLENIGFDVARVAFETQARNTHENVTLSMPIADPGADGRWIVITSAYHMPRTMGVLAAQGWEAVAWPVDYKSEGEAGRLFFTTSASEAMGLVDLAAKEWIGLVAYYVSGRTETLFPAPE